jgi:hypothetical protein
MLRYVCVAFVPLDLLSLLSLSDPILFQFREVTSRASAVDLARRCVRESGGAEEAALDRA